MAPECSSLRALFALCAALFVSSCSSSRVFQTGGNDGPVNGISDVRVSAGALDADSAVDYRSNSVSGALRSAIMEELNKRGRRADGGPVLEFSVTDFRLRSGSAVFWVGVMAGYDRLAGTVTVRQGGKVIKTFEASAKGNESAWSGMALGRIGAGSRVDVFCRMIARDVVKGL